MKSVVALLVLLFLMIGCGHRQPGEPPEPANVGEQGAQEGSIGMARMDGHRVITLQLRASDSAGTIGDALLIYPPDHPRYQSIVDHVGGLEPGQEKPVPPFSDEG